MFRAAARSFVAPAARRVAFAPAPVRFAAPSQLLAQQRFYAASSLSADTIKARIEDVLKSFEKVDSTKVSSPRFSVGFPRHVSPRSESRPEQMGQQHKHRARAQMAQILTLWTATPWQVTPTASFTSDLGLDSLDAVEVVMAIEGQSLSSRSLARPSRLGCSSCCTHHFADPALWNGLPNSTEEFAIEIPDEDADRITTVGEGESHLASHRQPRGAGMC